MSAGTSTGSKHAKNEDQYLTQPSLGLFAVADGMSVTHGDVASAIATQMIQEYVGSGKSPGKSPEALLREAVLAANFTIHRYGSSDPKRMGMGTTVTAAMFSSSGLIVAHVGDSRCLRVRPTSVEHLTKDHRTGGEAS